MERDKLCNIIKINTALYFYICYTEALFYPTTVACHFPLLYSDFSMVVFKIKIEWKKTNYAILSNLILLCIFIYAVQRHYFIRQLSLVTSLYLA